MRAVVLLIALFLLTYTGNIEVVENRNDDFKKFLKKKGLKICHQNIRGLLGNFCALQEFVSSHGNVDVLTLSETHISNNERNENLYKLSGYNFESRIRNSGKGGGVAVYVKENISYIRRKDLESENIENIVIEIIIKESKNVLIATHYRPPNSSKHLCKDFNDIFNESLSRCCSESKETILLGDLNADYLKKNDNKELKSIIQQNGFTQIIKNPTRITKDSNTLIDIIATNYPANIVSSCVTATSLSDHDLVICVRKINNKKFPAKITRCRNYRNYDPEQMKKDFASVNWTPVMTATNVNDALTIFNIIVKSIFDKHAPYTTKRSKSRPCQWITDDIKNNMNERDRILRKARKYNDQKDWNDYKSMRNRCNIMTRKAKSLYTKELIDQKCHNPKEFWKSVKEIFPTKNIRQVTVNDASFNKCKAQQFGEYFSNIVTSLKDSAFKLRDCVWKHRASVATRTDNVFQFQYVSTVFVKSFLKKVKRSKATGPDDLPAGMLKDCADYIAVPLRYIVNLSLKTSIVPSAWKEAKIIPIYKSGASSLVENYRPISVLPILSKVLEKAVHTQLSTFLETNKLLNDSQFGYRENRSTDLASALLIDNIRRNGDSGLLTGTLFLDLRKAFDTINHDLIIKKLASYGVGNHETNWFSDYLFGRSQTAIVGNQKSSKFNVSCGVPQGSILGPLLFLIFFNDFPEHLSKAKCLQYADDTVIYFASSDVCEIEKVLQDEINHIHTYFENNELILNLNKGKTETMLFGTSKRIGSKTIGIEMKNTKINHTTTYCYLGNELDPSLTMNHNFEKRYRKASGRLNLLAKMRSFLSVEAAYKIFEMVIVPVLLYSSLIHLQLTATQKRKLESIEERAKRIIGGEKRICGIERRAKKRCCRIVKKCLDEKLCSNFTGYFEINKHQLNTRNSNFLLKLPKINLEFGKKSFLYQGAKIYNDLPLAIRSSNRNFNTLLKDYFI